MELGDLEGGMLWVFLLPGHFIQKSNLHPAPAEEGRLWRPTRGAQCLEVGGPRGDSDAAPQPSHAPPPAGGWKLDVDPTFAAGRGGADASGSGPAV